ncbi:MAG: outer membrane beta-barrel protein [Candidatus Palauibacterales bacterium]|nr:outer membrane beta-barrel protein [Candidatus Palauibacterales bacterium]
MQNLKLTAIAVLAALFIPATASAQLVKITPKVGAHFADASVRNIDDQVGTTISERSVSSFAFGANAEIGAPGFPLGLRADVVLGTGNEATLDAEQLESTLVGVSGSLVLRPLSMLPFVDPYLLGGGGFTSTSYDATQFEGDLPTDREFALHTGLGTDISLGGTRLQVEATDYITGFDTDFDVQHDIFVTAGLGFSFP